jgi:hypothetical protein
MHFQRDSYALQDRNEYCFPVRRRKEWRAERENEMTLRSVSFIGWASIVTAFDVLILLGKFDWLAVLVPVTILLWCGSLRPGKHRAN